MTSPVPLNKQAQADLETFAELALQWTDRINLVAPSTKDVFWQRHIIDSAQVFHVKQNWSGHYVDLGSGGGLPGLVCAILAKVKSAPMQTTFVESDQRKCTFLRTVIRKLSLNAKVHTARIESLPNLQADILTARALAPLPKLLEMADRHMSPTGTALFPKGETWKQDVDAARQGWHFSLTTHPSVTHPESRILEIERIARVENPS